MERMNPTGSLVPTVVAASRAPPSVPSVRCSSQLVPPPRLYQDCAPACTSAGNAADVTTARLERSLRLGTCWQEGKRSVPQATWFLPLLLFAPLLLALCAVLHVFLDGWTEWPLPSCQVAKLPSCQIGELADETNPLRQCCRLARLLVVSVLSLPKNFRSKRTEVSMCYKTCKNFAHN